MNDDTIELMLKLLLPIRITIQQKYIQINNNKTDYLLQYISILTNSDILSSLCKHRKQSNAYLQFIEKVYIFHKNY